MLQNRERLGSWPALPSPLQTGRQSRQHGEGHGIALREVCGGVPAQSQSPVRNARLGTCWKSLANASETTAAGQLMFLSTSESEAAETREALMHPYLDGSLSAHVVVISVLTRFASGRDKALERHHLLHWALFASLRRKPWSISRGCSIVDDFVQLMTGAKMERDIC